MASPAGQRSLRDYLVLSMQERRGAESPFLYQSQIDSGTITVKITPNSKHDFSGRAFIVLLRGTDHEADLASKVEMAVRKEAQGFEMTVYWIGASFLLVASFPDQFVSEANKVLQESGVQLELPRKRTISHKRNDHFILRLNPQGRQNFYTINKISANPIS